MEAKIALGTNYAADRQSGRLIELFNQLHTLCFCSNDDGLSCAPCKQVVAVKSLNNYSNNKPHDSHGFKEEVKIKYDAVKAITGEFPN
mmetsp:Transcript_68202/g.76353  ORF Transcript_68202/g.76353 Transcript_68202/m.76353 type:complete len:88 (-) Transcript_68202:3-266(-)